MMPKHNITYYTNKVTNLSRKMWNQTKSNPDPQKILLRVCP